MAKNLRALTDEELAYFNDRYTFEYADGNVIVKCNHYKSIKLHPADKPFPLVTPVRKIKISLQAIELWINEYLGKHSLIDVQNAISVLIITYQDVSLENIDKQLKRNGTKIKEV